MSVVISVLFHVIQNFQNLRRIDVVNLFIPIVFKNDRKWMPVLFVNVYNVPHLNLPIQLFFKMVNLCLVVSIIHAIVRFVPNVVVYGLFVVVVMIILLLIIL